MIVSLNLLQYFQPGFPLPPFHRCHQVNQTDNLALAVFLQKQDNAPSHEQVVKDLNIDSTETRCHNGSSRNVSP